MTRVIDFRDIYWGHNLMNMNLEEGSVLIICTPRPIAGDDMVYNTGYGEAYVTLTDVEWLVDPSDMYRVKFDNIRRYVREELREELEKDKPFEPDGWIQ